MAYETRYFKIVSGQYLLLIGFERKPAIIKITSWIMGPILKSQKNKSAQQCCAAAHGTIIQPGRLTQSRDCTPKFAHLDTIFFHEIYEYANGAVVCNCFRYVTTVTTFIWLYWQYH